jgi:mRNA-degrading endonuclease RelE of RelBE toxin-antitoxin system
MFRCRVWKIRIIYSYKNEHVFIEDIAYRGNIYKGKK